LQTTPLKWHGSSRRHRRRPDEGTLHAAARHGRLEALELGLSVGLAIDAVDGRGLTALHHAVHAGHLDIARALVARGASLTVRDPTYDGTPLGHARHTADHWPGAQRRELVVFLEGAAERAAAM